MSTYLCILTIDIKRLKKENLVTPQNTVTGKSTKNAAREDVVYYDVVDTGRGACTKPKTVITTSNAAYNAFAK